MSAIHGRIAISAPLPGQDWSPDGKKLSIASIMGGTIRTLENGVWGDTDWSNPNYVEGSVAGLAADAFYFVYIYSVNRKPVVEFSQTAFEKTTDGVSQIEVKIGDPTRSLVGFCYTKGGALTFDSLNGQSLTANWFPCGNKLPIETPMVARSISGNAAFPAGSAPVQDVAICAVSSPCAGVRPTFQGYVDGADIASIIEFKIKCSWVNATSSGATPLSTSQQIIRKRITTRPDGGPVEFSITGAQPYNAQYNRFELWASMQAVGHSATIHAMGTADVLSA